MFFHYGLGVPWGHVLEHGLWVFVLGVLLLASTFFQNELPYSAFFTIFLIVVLLLPAETGWNCIVVMSCHYSPVLSPIHFFVLFGLVLVWLIAPMILAAAVIEPWIMRHSSLYPVQALRWRAICVYLVGTILSLGISMVGGANSHFWTEDTTLRESLFINIAFVLPITLLPIGATCLRRILFAICRRLCTTPPRPQ